jgi:hypothetical protein
MIELLMVVGISLSAEPLPCSPTVEQVAEAVEQAPLQPVFVEPCVERGPF